MNTFYKYMYINNKQQTNENIHPLLDVRGNDEEKCA